MPVPVLMSEPRPLKIPEKAVLAWLPPTVSTTGLVLALVSERDWAPERPPRVAAVSEPKESEPPWLLKLRVLFWSARA